MSRGAEDVVEQVRSHVGDALRALVIYDGDARRDLYRRPDLQGADPELDIRRGAQPAATGPDHRATVRVSDSRVVVQLPRDESSGTVLVLDPSAARNLVDFVADAREAIYSP